MRVLGIDPGTHRLGWGVVDGTPSTQTLVACGLIESQKLTQSGEYLQKIKQGVDKLIATYNPAMLSIETLLFQKNAKTAISVAQARGVVLLAAAEHNLTLREIAPNAIKATVAGSGSAGKKELSRMVGLLLHLQTQELIDDTTDALAAAIAGLVTHKL